MQAHATLDWPSQQKKLRPRGAEREPNKPASRGEPLLMIQCDSLGAQTLADFSRLNPPLA